MSLKLKKNSSSYSNNRRSGPRGVSNIPMYMDERYNDHAVGELVTDFGDLKAGTKVAVVLREINQEGKKKKRPEIKDFRVGGKIGTSPVFGQRMAIVAENAYLDYKQTIDGLPVINSRWIKVGLHDVENPGMNVWAAGLVSVERLQKRKGGADGEFFVQNRHLIQPEDAFRFSNEQEFRDAAKQWLEFESNIQLIVRVTDHAAILEAEGLDTEFPHVMTKRLRKFWNGPEKREMTVDESIEFFLDGPQEIDGQPNEDFGMWREFIEKAESEGQNFTFDVIVSRVIPSGKATIENIVDNSSRFDADGSLHFSTPVDGRDMRAFMFGTMFMRNTTGNDGNNRIIATDTFAQNAFSPVYTEEDLPGARGEDVQKYFDVVAIARGEERDQKNKNDREEDPRFASEEDKTQKSSPGLSMS